MKWLKAENKPDKIDIDDLSISFSQPFHDYVIYAPWNPGEYITHIGDYTLGFGARYLLLRVLTQIKEDMSNEVETYFVKTAPIPSIDTSIVRRLGKKYLKPVCKKFLNPLTKKIEEQRTRFIPLINSVNEIADGDENISKEVNRREENFEVSKA